MVATGNKPAYGVRHLPEKSKGIFAPILLGSEYDFREPCGTGGLRVCLERFITIWVTPGNGSRSCYFAAKLFYNSIFRVSKWFFFLHTPAHLKTFAYVRRNGSMSTSCSFPFSGLFGDNHERILARGAPSCFHSQLK